MRRENGGVERSFRRDRDLRVEGFGGMRDVVVEVEVVVRDEGREEERRER